MRSRIAARLITGPFAFALAGVIDLLTFALTARRARRARIASRTGTARKHSSR